jgi:hypothetical protein
VQPENRICAAAPAPAQPKEKKAKAPEAQPEEKAKAPETAAKAASPEKKASAGRSEQSTETAPEPEARPVDMEIPDIPYDMMTVEQLQAVILAKMAKNGPVTERMRREVTENIWHNSLVNWARSFG